MPEEANGFDEFLTRAFAAGVNDPIDDADSAEPVEIPPDLFAQVIDRAAVRSSQLLVRRMLRMAKRHGYSPDALAREAGGYEQLARGFLSKGGNPRRVPAASMARMLWRTGLQPQTWAALIRQAIIGSDKRTNVADAPIWGRTATLSAPERHETLSGHQSAANTKRSPTAADQYVAEVIQEWTTLMGGDKNNE